MPKAQTGVSAQDVAWCFENILGRKLTDEKAIDHFVRTEGDFRSLVTTLVASHEFRSLHGSARLRGVDRDGFVYDDLLATQHRAMRILKRLAPHAVANHLKLRIGNNGDGGYVMLDDFSKIDAAYSLGINDDVTWDRAIAERGIDIFQYDHTIDGPPEKNSRFHWFKKGIAAVAGGEFETLPNLMRRNGHERSNNLILKCDIEGHEWEVLAGMTPPQLGQFRQIVLETHGWGHIGTAAFGERVEKAIENLTAHHRLIHVHANNHAGYAIIGGIAIPAVLEMTFLRAADYELSPSSETFPTLLDVPCSAARADYQLGSFRF